MDVDIECCKTSYGKIGVKILYVNRDSPVHQIKEFQVGTALKNDSDDELHGDNRKIVPTDTQKNTIYILAKKYGIKSAEAFALIVSNWFIEKYPWVIEAKIDIKEMPWQRVEKNGEKHIHAFVNSHDAIKVCEVIQAKGEQPRVTSGVSGLHFIKTGQSGFENFNQCSFTVLPDSRDRILSSVVDGTWTYNNVHGMDFCKTWKSIKDCILDIIVGPPKTGVYSGGVQETAFTIEKEIMKKFPQVERIKLTMPNVHYFNFDFSKFRSLPYKDDNTVGTALKNDSGDELHGDNRKLVATDTQKNTIYILAKKYGIKSAEAFALIVSNWFIEKYPWVIEAKIDIKEMPWQRVEKNGEKHIHAFVNSHDAIKVCEVIQAKGEQPRVTSGVSGLHFIKTTQSGFENFNQCSFTIMPYSRDRVLSSVIDSTWTYNNVHGMDFDKTWKTIKDCILDIVVGPPKTGVYSGGVQGTAFTIEKEIMKKFPQVERIKVTMPNMHYFKFDFSKFRSLPYKDDNTVFVPQTNPSGLIVTEAYRKPNSKL
ncbi:Uricase [Nymphon striatum]|nr:Uricase [Nymphon striatum]